MNNFASKTMRRSRNSSRGDGIKSYDPRVDQIDRIDRNKVWGNSDVQGCGSGILDAEEVKLSPIKSSRDPYNDDLIIGRGINGIKNKEKFDYRLAFKSK
jgi:hypothetical protein